MVLDFSIGKYSYDQKNDNAPHHSITIPFVNRLTFEFELNRAQRSLESKEGKSWNSIMQKTQSRSSLLLEVHLIRKPEEMKA